MNWIALIVFVALAVLSTILGEWEKRQQLVGVAAFLYWSAILLIAIGLWCSLFALVGVQAIATVFAIVLGLVFLGAIGSLATRGR